MLAHIHTKAGVRTDCCFDFVTGLVRQMAVVRRQMQEMARVAGGRWGNPQPDFVADLTNSS